MNMFLSTSMFLSILCRCHPPGDPLLLARAPSVVVIVVVVIVFVIDSWPHLLENKRFEGWAFGMRF